jgi:hypothetical protein
VFQRFPVFLFELSGQVLAGCLAGQDRQPGLLQGRQRERAGAQQTLQRTLMAAFEDQPAIEAIDGLVLRYDQAAAVTRELNERFRSGQVISRELSGPERTQRMACRDLTEEWRSTHLRGRHTAPIIVSKRLVPKTCRKRRVFCSKGAFFPPERAAGLESAGRKAMWVRLPLAPFAVAALI